VLREARTASRRQDKASLAECILGRERLGRLKKGTTRDESIACRVNSNISSQSMRQQHQKTDAGVVEQAIHRDIKH
jgi:uncharacterized Ntn-hydrolase superfamily protein